MRSSPGTKAHAGCLQIDRDKNAEQHTDHTDAGTQATDRQTDTSSQARAETQAFNLKAIFIQNYTKVALCQK